VGEPLGKTLGTIHNIHYFMTLMDRIRQAILEDRFPAFKKAFLQTGTFD
jgi:queuine tRNA-ribosyltransferase